MTQSGRGFGPWVAPSQVDQRSPSGGASGRLSIENEGLSSGRWNGWCATEVSSGEGRDGRGRGPGQSWTSRPPSVRRWRGTAADAVRLAPSVDCSAPPAAARRRQPQLPVLRRGRAPAGGGTHTRSALCPPVTPRHTREQIPIPQREGGDHRMSRLQQTDGLTEEQRELVKLVREFVDEQIIPVAHRARARGRVPDRDRRGHEGDGPLRADDPRGVRRAGRVAADLRARASRRSPAAGCASAASSTPTSSWPTCSSSTAPRSRSSSYLPRMATGEVRGAFSMSEPGLRLRRRGDQDQGGARRRRRLRRSTARRCG